LLAHIIYYYVLYSKQTNLIEKMRAGGAITAGALLVLGDSNPVDLKVWLLYWI
jgi:hypothetical protein